MSENISDTESAEIDVEANSPTQKTPTNIYYKKGVLKYLQIFFIFQSKINFTSIYLFSSFSKKFAIVLIFLTVFTLLGIALGLLPIYLAGNENI